MSPSYNQSPFGRSPRVAFKTRLHDFFCNKSVLNRLILVNVCIFLVYWLLAFILKIAAFLWNNDLDSFVMEWVVNNLSCPASFESALYQPWCYITSLFLHTQFWHLFFNMLMLWVAGKLFRSQLSEKQLLITYILGGLIGNVAYQAAYSLFPVFSTSLPFAHALGASGAIMALFAAIATYSPRQQINFIFFGGIKIVWIFVAFVVMDLMSIPKENAGGHIAHLGGALYGAIYVLLFFYLPKMNFKVFHKKASSVKQKRKKYYVSQSSYRMSDEEYNARKTENARKTDEILDKISQFGYDALTKEEKEFLFNQRR
ncbi:MAG: rhomboid family intramembrane serine protease [Bacteroidales bacterium]|nr:rhomboid family intramembrane serine protease [Bacteroidales bacterium]